MTLAEIQAEHNLGKLHLSWASEVGADGNPVRQIDKETGKPTLWLRHWDNDQRIAVSLHEDTYKVWAEDNETDRLGVQEEIREGSLGEYKALRIVAYKPSVYSMG